MWERFGALSPKPVEFKAIKPKKVIVDGEEREKTSHYKPRGLRWSSIKATDKKALSRVIDVEKNTTFNQTHTPLVRLLHCPIRVRKSRWCPKWTIPLLFVLLAIAASALLPSKLDRKECR